MKKTTGTKDSTRRVYTEKCDWFQRTIYSTEKYNGGLALASPVRCGKHGVMLSFGQLGV